MRRAAKSHCKGYGSQRIMTTFALKSPLTLKPTFSFLHGFPNSIYIVLVPSKCITRVPHIYFSIGEGNGTPLQYFCLENPMDRGAW